MTTLTMTIETAAPVHIGSGGADLRREIDFAVFGQELFMFEPDAVFNYILDQNNDAMIEQLLKTHNIASFFQNNQDLLNNPALYRYKLKGVPKLEQIRPVVKTIHGMPYIPGSSLKGALRTAWLRWVYERRNLKAPRPAQRPNYDLFRAIQVADSQPAPDDSLRLYNAVVFPAGPKGIPIDIEGIKPRIVLQSRLKIDDFILQSPQFGASEQQFSLANLKTAWREQGIKRIADEIVFWTGNPQGQQILKFLHDLEANAKNADENTFFIEVGWGTGWRSKTLGRVLLQHDVARLMSKYRLSRSNTPNPDRFPKTRRAARDSKGELRVPFGWVKVTLN